MNEDLNPLNVPEPNAIDQESRVQDILHKVGEESYGTPLQMTEALIPQETRKAPPMTLTDAVHMWDTVLGSNINAAPNMPVDVIKTAATPPAGNLAMMLPPPAPLDNNGKPIIGSAPDIWDEAFGNIREGQRRAIRASMGLVADKNPDEVAKQQQEAASLGASFDIYTRNRAAFQKQYRMDDVVSQDLPTSAPVLADYMTNPNFAAIAQDDVSHLSAWEKTAKYISDMFVDSSQVLVPSNPDAIFSPEFWMFDPQAPEVLKSVGENLTVVKGFKHGYNTRAMWEYSAAQVGGDPMLMEPLYGVEDKASSTARIIAWNKELNEGPPTAMSVIQHATPDFLFDYVKEARDKAYANAIDRGASEYDAKIIADQAAAGAMRPPPTSIAPHGAIGIIADMVGMEAHKIRQRALTVGGAFVGGELAGLVAGGAPALVTGPVAARVAWQATAAEQAVRDSVGMIYSRALAEGVSPEDAAHVAIAYAGPLALVNFGLERLTMPGFTSNAVKKEIAEATARRIEQAVAKPSVMAATRRVAGEYTGTLLKGSAFATLQVVGLELANDQARAESGMVPLIATPEGREQFGKNVADNLEYMLIGIAGMSVLSPTEHNPIMRAAQEAAAISRGKAIHAQLDTILRLSRESALQRRSPDAAASFQNDAAAAAEFPHIYISKQGLLDALGRLNIPIERLDQILPGASEQLKDQSNGEAGINGYVKIKSGDFFSKVGETDLGRALRQHITADPDVPTWSEAVAAERFRSKFNDSPEEMVREVNDRVVKNEEHERQLDAIQQKFEQDALGAGRSPEESQVIGVFGRSMLRGLANALKLSPEEAHRKFGYRVVGEPTAERPAETPAARVEAEPMSESDVHPLSRAVGGLAARVSEHNARVANEGRDASHPEAKVGRALNDSVRRLQTAIDAKDEVDIASQAWRLRNRLKASREHLNANTVKAIETMLAKTDAFMQQRGLEISDPIGEQYVDGWVEHDVVAWMPPANGEPATGTGGTITQVMEPGVVRVTGNKREVLQKGDVVVTNDTPEQAAQREANLAQREADLRARLTGTQAAERGAGAEETLQQEELRGASEPRLMAVHNLSAENLAHADQIGGLAVPSIGVVTEQAGGVENFGEITLVGRRGMAAPETSRAFAGDAYTTRFPRAEWAKVAYAAADKFVAQLKGIAAKFGDSSIVDATFDGMVNHPDAENVAGQWLRSPAIQALFLEQRGIEIEPVRDVAKSLTGLPWESVDRLRQAYEDLRKSNVSGEEEMQSPEWAALRQAYANEIRNYWADKDHGLDQAQIEKWANDFGYGTISRIGRDLERANRERVDRYETQIRLETALEPYRAEFKEWVEKTVKEQFDPPFIRVGNLKKPYTLGNIVDAMTSQKVKGREKTMTFGEGAARAKAATEFKTLEQMREAAKSAIVNPKEYGKANKETSAKLESYRNAVLDFTTLTDWRGKPDTWEALDGSMRAIADYGKRARRNPEAMRRALQREGFAAERMSPELIDQAIDAADALFRAPVPYFEAKPQRAVGLGEFAAAIIPADASPETVNILEKHGIPYMSYTPNDEGDRQRVVRQAAAEANVNGDVLFQRPLEQPAFGPSKGVQGSFNLRTLEIMLTKRATWRTAAHEFIHAYWNGFLSISSMENAPPHVLRDIDTVLSWMGIEGATPEERRTKYMSMSLEERRPHEEALAYSGEVYFSEGKAPNEELRGVFERLSQWMLKLYGDIRGKLNDDYRARYGRDLPILTGEVRQVFDRWMAAEDTITHTETMREMKGVWQTREESPLNDVEWADYQEKQQSAHDASVADLNTRSIQVQERIGRLEESTKRGIVAKAKKIRAAVREEIADAVGAEPLYRAMQFLKRGLIRNDKGEDVKSDTVVKLNRDVVVSMIGEDAAAALGGGKYGMLSKDGVHPDVVAEMFGFESGKAFVERLSVAPTFEKAVEFRTDQRMIREHSDLTDPTKIQRAVDEAVHNVARREFVALEFKLLARATEPVKIMAEAARSVAMDRINGMRIKDINQRQHILAESKAARTALDAVQATPPKIDMERIVEKARTAAVAQSLKDGKTEVEAALAGELAAVDARAKAQRRLDAFREKYGDKDPHEVAIRAKRQQLLQSHLATAALDALNEVDAAMDGIKKIFGSDEKIGKTRDFNMVLAARSILAHFGLGRSDKTPAEYLKNVEQFNPSLYADLKPILDRLSAGPQDYRELTMVEFRGVMDAVNALWENARRDKIVMIDGKRVAVADAIGELRARMEEIRPTEAKPISGAATDLDRFMRRANEWKTVWRRVEHWCAAMDGPNGPGPFTKFIWRPIVAAMDAYRADYAKYVERYGDMVRSLKLPSGKIEARELGYTFGNGNGGNGLLELLGAMLHTGNDSNLQKLLRGYGWGHLDADGNLVTTKWDTFVNRMIKEGVLTKEHFDFLQAVWKLNEGLGDLAQRAKYDMDGCYYDKIKPRSFETPWGMYEGGYVPAAVDEYLVSDIERIRSLEQIDADFRSDMPGVAFGFTKSRNEGFAKPLALDLRIIGKHIDSVLRYVHVAPAIKDVTRLLKNGEFASKLNELDPNAINKLIIPMLERAARNSITKPGLDPSVDRFWSTIRRRTSLNFMAANLRQFGHAGGFTAAYVKVDAGQLHSALAQYTMNPSQVATDIAKMSPMMDERLHNQVMDARDRLMDILESRGPVGKTEAWFRNHGMFLSHALHNQMDIIIWLGKFNETMEKLGPEVGMDEAKQEAIHQADAAVRMTQGSSHAEDVARYQTGTPFAQAMFSFTGYLNTIANLNADEFVMSMRDMGIAKGAGRLVYSHIMAYAIPMMVFEAFAKTVSGDWNKKKHDSLLHDVLEFIFASYAHGAVGMIPGGSQIYSGATAIAHAVQRVEGGPVPFHGDHIEVAPTIAALESATVGTAEAIARLTSKNKKVTGHNVRDVMTLMSLLTGVPTAPVAKPIGYMMDVNQKKIRPTSTYDYVRGAVSGVGSPASKNQ